MTVKSSRNSGRTHATRAARLAGFAVVLSLVTAACTAEDSSTPAGGDTNAADPAPAAPAAPEETPITIRVVNAFQNSDPLTAGYVELERQMNERSGSITLLNLGASEVIPNFELGDAVRDGVIDAFVAPNYHLDAVPEARAMVMSELTIQEEIERGSIEFMNQVHNEKLNAQYIGRLSTLDFSYFLRDPVSSIDDFRGLRLRGSPGHVPKARALGYELTQMPGGEIYTSLERGVIDGFAWGSVGITDFGLHEQVSYMTQPSYWNMDVVMVMNLDTWNSMSPSQQETFMSIFADVQAELPAITAELFTQQSEVFEEFGIQTIDLGPEFRQRIFDESWEWIIDREPNGDDLARFFRRNP